MNLFFVTAAITLFQLMLPPPDPMKQLQDARQKLNDHGSFSYKYRYQRPGTNGVEKKSGSCSFAKSPASLIGYDFVAKSDDTDEVFINGKFQQVLYSGKKVVLFPDEMQKQMSFNLIPLSYSPLLILKKKLSFVKDTLMRDQAYAEYKLVKIDSLVHGQKIQTEDHVFINKKSSLLERYEDRRYVDGKFSYLVVFEYSGYTFIKGESLIEYSFPEGFRTELLGQDSEAQPLHEGLKAPAFSTIDITGNRISLDRFRGKRVLLDFSILGCGYCKMAADHFTRPGFKLQDDIVVIYINPVDKKSTMELYSKKENIAFPVIAEAADLCNVYSVTGYPTFYLIDSNGYIEKTVIGYNKTFLDDLAQ